MEDDWDLQAVVRGCSAAATTTSSSYSSTTTTTTTTTSCSTDDIFVWFPDLFKQENEKIEELHDVFKPYFPKSQPLSPELIIPISPLSVLGGLQDLSHTKQSVVGPRTTIRHAQSTPRSKRRKNQLKKVCQVAAEGLSSDMWSWRKYGQKPIKGSPYPRGYYRCSTSKGCLARKQVERDRSDPAMFIVTYTGDHNHPMPTHRNSLAGSTRQKPVTSGDANKPSCSPPVSPATSISPATENIESREEREDDDDDEFGVSNMVMSDDFFTGLEESSSPVDGYSFLWLANSGTTTAGGGG